MSSFKRSEIYRSKDKIIDRLDKLQEWIAKELKSIKDASDREKSLPLIENYSSSKITQIELRLTQFNSYIKYDLFDVERLASVRDIDFFETQDEKLLLKKINNNFSDLIEYIEIEFERYTAKSLSNQLSLYWREFVTFSTTLLSVYIILQILRYFFG